MNEGSCKKARVKEREMSASEGYWGETTEGQRGTREQHLIVLYNTLRCVPGSNSFSLLQWDTFLLSEHQTSLRLDVN